MTAGERLIVFTRFPVPGRVKTRLIPALGADGAAGLHRQLTLRTMRTAESLRKHRSSQLQVHFEGGNVSAMQHWLGDRNSFVAQSSGHLGERMASVFRNAFQEGMTAAIIIGTDCPQLSPEILNKAFDALRASDVVLGPAHDGGYYLIGLSRFIPEIFEEIAWGTERVLSQTLQALAGKGLQPVLLNRLPDIDQPEDLPIWYSVVQDEERDVAELSVIIPALNEARNISRIVEAAKPG